MITTALNTEGYHDLYATLGTNNDTNTGIPAGEYNLQYNSYIDTLYVENVNLGGTFIVPSGSTVDFLNGANLTVDEGTNVTGLTVDNAGDTWLGAENAVKTGGSLRLDNNVPLRFGTSGADGTHSIVSTGVRLNINANADQLIAIKDSNDADQFTFFTFDGSFTAAGDINSLSDERVKENIIDIDFALDKVTQLRGVYFNKKNDESHTRKVGVIAQEVEEVLPEVVSTGEDGYKSVAYANLSGILIESIKELNNHVNDLTEQLNELKDK